MGKSKVDILPDKVSALREKVLRRFSGLILYILITILVISLSAGKYGSLESLAVAMQDGMLKLRGQIHAPPADVVIVGIDNRSADHVGKWPWQGDILAGLIFAISRGHPKVIGLDIFISDYMEEDTAGRTDILAHEIHAAGNVILPIYFSYSDVGIIPAPAPDPVLQSAGGGCDDLKKTTSCLPSARQIYYPSRAALEAAHGFGHVNIDYDTDGSVRKEPLFINYEGQLYPSFGLRLASAYRNIGPDRITTGETSVRLGETTIPTDKRQRMLLNYRGPNLSFQRVSAVEVLAGEVAPNIFRDKIVLVGLTTTQSKVWVNIPAFGEANEVERIATVAENIIHRDFLRYLSPLWSMVMLVAIGIFCALVLPNVSLILRMAILLVFLFVVSNISYILFSSFGILSKPIYPILELLLFLIAAPAIKTSERGYKRVEVIRPRGESCRLELAAQLSAEHTEKVLSDARTGAPTPTETTELAGEETEQICTQPSQSAVNGTIAGAGSRTPSGLKDSPGEDRRPGRPASPVPSEQKDESLTATPSEGTPVLTQLGRYRIIRVLGRGGMGTVYEGVDPILDRPVALKTIRLDFAFSPEEIRRLKERLIQEAKAAGRLSHPNIVTIYDVGEQQGLYYVAMEYLSGYTLEEFIKKKGELNYRIAAKIIIQACDALSYAHSHGIVHRDIKPGNIMLLENFHAKVMDFGVARLDTTSLTQSNVALGTPHYIAPEQLEGRTADKRSDIFSLGVVVYELLTKQKPFRGENISSLMYRILNYDPPPPSTINVKTPVVFDNIVAKAMAKKPDQRQQDADEISTVLKEFVSSFVVTRSISV